MQLALVGDVMLGRIVNETLRSRTPESAWGDTLPIFHQVDFGMCNLECAISDRGEPCALTPKEFHFRSDSKNVRVLRTAGIRAVSLANNHALDFGYEALSDTLRSLDKEGIHHAGAGLSSDEASEPAIAQCKGSKIGIVAITDNQPEWEARENNPGIFYVPIDLRDHRAKKLIDILKRTKTAVDTLIVSAHWGPNWGYEPPEEHTRFAHSLIDAGADIIFGHSSHVFRGVEIYNRRPILYCTGDFIDDYAVDAVERNDESFVFVLEKKGASFSRLRLYPTMIEDCSARLAHVPERYAISEKMQFLSSKLNASFLWKEEKGFGYLELDI
ncbi:MAG: CapA family protein [Nitrososphaerota archaeon]|nr:CapA family protein [Nitrososphaerota archaeon]